MWGMESKVESSNQNLSGKTILVTRAAEQSSQFSELLEKEGATVIEMPALVITPPSSWVELDNAIANLSHFDWLILTSSNAVDYFFARLLAQGKDNSALAEVKIAVVGKKTATSLKQYNLQPDFIPPNFVADSLVEHFPEPLTNKKILFPRVETGGRDILVKELTAQGGEIIEVPAYESGCPIQIAPTAWEALLAGKVDIITFASSKTVKNFYQLLEKALIQNLNTTSHSPLPTSHSPLPTPHSLLEKVCIASIGPQTSQTCHELLGRVDVEAQEYTLAGLTSAIAQWARGITPNL